jgi:hypothetical protein
MTIEFNIRNILGWIFGILVIAIGLINLFWGNDPEFGAFLILLSFVYYPPVNVLIKKLTNLSIPGFVKIILGIFVIWAALGVGELFDKIDLMLMDF